MTLAEKGLPNDRDLIVIKEFTGNVNANLTTLA